MLVRSIEVTTTLDKLTVAPFYVKLYMRYYMLQRYIGRNLPLLKTTQRGRMPEILVSAMVILSLGGCTGLSEPRVSAGESMEASQQLTRDYRIGPEDMLEISVWKEEELQREVLVRPDGGISFPLAGDIRVAGKTPQEVEAVITEKLQRYIPDAVVTVSVTELTGHRIYVAGRVENPGQYVVGRYVDVLQALTLAGGLTPFAKEKEIKVLRREAGKEIVYPFNYDEVKEGTHLEQNMVLRNDDVVVVP